MKKLTDNLYVSGQIHVSDLDNIATRNIKTIINNRPDNEIPFQPESADLKSAAEQYGMAYYDIPIAGGQIRPNQAKALTEILENCDKPVLAFCASGTRSTMLWAISQVQNLSTEEIISTALDAGYDFRGYTAMLDSIRMQ